MALSVYDLDIGPVASSFTALGTNGASIVHLASGSIPSSGRLRITADPDLDPLIVLGNADGECSRLYPRANSVDQIDPAGTVPSGCSADAYERLEAVIEGINRVNLRGRVNRESGSPTSLLHIAESIRTKQKVSVQAIMVGIDSATICAASIGTDGVVTLEAGTGGASADYDVSLSGSWNI